MTKVVAVIAAHSDDEALGCGGTIARHIAEGDQVHAIFLTDGVSSRSDVDLSELRKRKQAAEVAHKILGLHSVHYLENPDNRLDSLPLLDIVQQLESVVHPLSPEVIYTHHYGDLNIDHRITHEAVMTACRPLPGSTTKEIYAFEIMSSSEWNSPGKSSFCPQYYVDISPYLELKLKALEAYALEMRDAPHSRSIQHIQALAIHRGHSAGVASAEAFMLMRSLR